MNDENERDAKARALSSSLRIRILRICLHEAHTNKEIANILGLNPGSVLHHVRRLVDTGFLAAEEPRRGARGATEFPYIATRISWRHPVDSIAPVLVDTFLSEIEGLKPNQLDIARLGLKLSAEKTLEFNERFRALLQEYAALPSEPNGEAISIFLAVHPDQASSSRPPPR